MGQAMGISRLSQPPDGHVAASLTADDVLQDIQKLKTDSRFLMRVSVPTSKLPYHSSPFLLQAHKKAINIADAAKHASWIPASLACSNLLDQNQLPTWFLFQCVGDNPFRSEEAPSSMFRAKPRHIDTDPNPGQTRLRV
ncbi:hypothetical protein QC762_0076740 [Podospora pseudocomata]|uniref:Uncharacterized protein n=1 Tax=Podospora pseudocomata TaxID=2093779 RepID=A0ABR0GAY7_9PEZI|nr:hypothetical protein QC762_0076740 [Podospora pseudocomata]